MHVAFHQLPPTARVWIYQASRPLTAAAQAAAAPALARFAAAWTSHGQQLHAAAEFRHDLFLLIGLDEAVAGASGCSIDASVRFVQELEQVLAVNLLDKSQLAFRRDGNIMQLPLGQLRAAVAAGAVREADLYFNNALITKAELDTQWPAPAAATWLRRYFEAAPPRALPV